jgi:hypothetical protein
MAGAPKSDDTAAAADAGYWIDQVQKSERWLEPYWQRCRAINRRYRNESIGALSQPYSDDANGPRRYSLLWSNIQTLAPTIYARKPEAVVTRRWDDEESKPAAVAAQVMERGVNYSNEQYDFDGKMRLDRDDFLLFARGQMWLRYVPRFKKRTKANPANDDVQVSNSEDAADEDVLDYEEVCQDHVSNDDWGHNPARTWAGVWLVWRRVAMSREQLIERFDVKLGEAIPLDFKPSEDGLGPNNTDDGKINANTAAIYEVWDKRGRRVVWISKGYKDQVLDERPDPLGLDEFFPCPRPLFGTLAADSAIPIPDFVYYQDQAREIDELTLRIDSLTDALKVRGFYNAESSTDLNNLFNGANNILIPVPGWDDLKEGGGAKGLVEWFPVEQVATVLQACVELREKLIQDVYQITGISDILRGESDPSETATAQRIKGQWGSLRVRDKQKEMARFARDVVRIKAQIIAEKFSPETLAQMTGVSLFADDKERQNAIVTLQMQQRQAQAMQQPAPPVPPDVQEKLSGPTWAEVMPILRNNALRSFQIDIETDSTIEPDEEQAKQQLTEFMGAITQMLTGALPVLQAFPKAAPIYAEALKEGARVFRVSRSMEEAVDKVFEEVAQLPPVDPNPQAAGPPPPDPAEQQAKVITAQARMIDAQTGAQQAQTDAQYDQADLNLRYGEQQLKAQALARDPTPQGSA